MIKFPGDFDTFKRPVPIKRDVIEARVKQVVKIVKSGKLFSYMRSGDTLVIAMDCGHVIEVYVCIHNGKTYNYEIPLGKETDSLKIELFNK